ncbi:MAG: hypothetical protein HY819_06010 [Acidobacteria bacterium]|nr:hypothetical protein [Acidobacteriota bacterium]
MLAKKTFLLTIILTSLFINTAFAQSGRVKQRDTNQNNSLSRPSNSNSTNNNSSILEKTPKTASNLIPKNTLLNLHLDQSLSSKTSKKGEEFIIRVSEPVIVNDQIVLTSTASVKCHIISVEPAARKGRNGSITIGFDELILDDGTKLKLRATLFSVVNRIDQVVEEDGEGKIKDPSKGRNKAGTIATQAGVGAGVGTIAGGAAGAGIGAGIGAGLGLGGVLLAKGRDIELLAGSRLQIRLDADVFINPNNPTTTAQ